jgi:hypothetical protein
MKAENKQAKYSEVVINKNIHHDSTSGRFIDRQDVDYNVFKNVYPDRKTSFGQNYANKSN